MDNTNNFSSNQGANRQDDSDQQGYNSKNQDMSDNEDQMSLAGGSDATSASGSNYQNYDDDIDTGDL